MKQRLRRSQAAKLKMSRSLSPTARNLSAIRPVPFLLIVTEAWK